jgi:hypothetical protein
VHGDDHRRSDAEVRGVERHREDDEQAEQTPCGGCLPPDQDRYHGEEDDLRSFQKTDHQRIVPDPQDERTV